MGQQQPLEQSKRLWHDNKSPLQITQHVRYSHFTCIIVAKSGQKGKRALWFYSLIFNLNETKKACSIRANYSLRSKR